MTYVNDCRYTIDTYTSNQIKCMLLLSQSTEYLKLIGVIKLLSIFSVIRLTILLFDC